MPQQDKADNMKDSLYKELECVFDNFHKYHTKILLGDLNVNVSKEDIFKPTFWNESLH
jgi:exonuclease III